MQTFYTVSMEEKKRAKEERSTPAKPSKRGAGGGAQPPDSKTQPKHGEVRPTSSGRRKSATSNPVSKGKKKQE